MNCNLQIKKWKNNYGKRKIKKKLNRNKGSRTINIKYKEKNGIKNNNKIKLKSKNWRLMQIRYLIRWNLLFQEKMLFRLN